MNTVPLADTPCGAVDGDAASAYASGYLARMSIPASRQAAGSAAHTTSGAPRSAIFACSADSFDTTDCRTFSIHAGSVRRVTASTSLRCRHSVHAARTFATWPGARSSQKTTVDWLARSVATTEARAVVASGPDAMAAVANSAATRPARTCCMWSSLERAMLGTAGRG